MTHFDIQYRDLAEEIMSFGKEHITRARDPLTGEQLKAKKLFKRSFLFDLREEFPILTTKKMPVSKTHPENGFLFWSEWYWIWVMGSNIVQDLRDLGNTVWDEWEIKEGKWKGTIGPAYGYQARKMAIPEFVRKAAPIYVPPGSDYKTRDIRFRHIDQVQNLIDGLKADPYGRRHIVDLWNVGDLPEMGLMPCALKTIWDVDPDGYLNCHLIQRSGDVPLGVPFNVSQYALAVHVIAHFTGLKPGYLAHDITNPHIYENQYEAIDKQLTRKSKDCQPTVWINPEVKDFNDLKVTDVKILNYESHPGIKIPVAV